MLLLGKPLGKTHFSFGKTCSLWLAASAPLVRHSFIVCGVGDRFYVLFWEKPVLGKPFAFSCACRGGCPFLGLLSADPLGKTPFGEKTFSGKNPWPLWENLYWGEKNPLEKPITYLRKTCFRKSIRKTHLGKNLVFF